MYRTELSSCASCAYLEVKQCQTGNCMQANIIFQLTAGSFLVLQQMEGWVKTHVSESPH